MPRDESWREWRRHCAEYRLEFNREYQRLQRTQASIEETSAQIDRVLEKIDAGLNRLYALSEQARQKRLEEKR